MQKIMTFYDVTKRYLTRDFRVYWFFLYRVYLFCFGLSMDIELMKTTICYNVSN